MAKMQRIGVIAGPTASGKSRLALEIAQKTPAVIINADSMQVYREIPILTAQPEMGEAAQVPHRLYGFLKLDEKCDAATWAALAAEEIRAAWAKGGLPILVGGTGLYLKTLIHGVSVIPEIPAAIRAQAKAMRDEMGAEEFYRQLIAKDAGSANLNAGDTQRVLRAYEVLAATGKPMYYWHAQPQKTYFAEAQFVGQILLPDRAALYAICDRRFEKMLKNGALEEAKAVIAKNYSPSSSGMKAIGIPELRAYLNGDWSLETAIEKACQATRNYAKRQYTWFQNQDLGLLPF